jgi:hypothetical protein
MKKLFMAVAALFIVSSTAMAQNESNQQKEQPNRTEMIQKRTDKMVNRYGLNSDQAKQLLELNTNYAGSFRGPMMGDHHRGERGGMGNRDSLQFRNRPAVTNEQKSSRMNEMSEKNDAYNKELQKIMTTEQFKSYQNDQQKMLLMRNSDPNKEFNNK